MENILEQSYIHLFQQILLQTLLIIQINVLSSNFDFLSQDKERVINFLKENNFSFYSDISLEEVIGEGAVKAVKISPLKVFSSQLVFIDSGFLPNRNFFEEEIQLKDTFFSNYEGVYFLGDVNHKSLDNDFFYLFNQEEAINQASIFSDFLLKGENPHFGRKIVTQEERDKAINNILKN